MADKHPDKTRALADRVIELGEEVESFSQASVEEAQLKIARAVLHKWVDELAGVVLTPGFGRVTLIHPGGRGSTLSSWELCLELSNARNAGDKQGDPA